MLIFPLKKSRVDTGQRIDIRRNGTVSWGKLIFDGMVKHGGPSQVGYIAALITAFHYIKYIFHFSPVPGA
jgi:hypothetical protein